MKVKRDTPQENPEEIRLDFSPPLPSPSYSIVSQVMPNGRKELLGYILRHEEYNSAEDYIYYSYDLNLKPIFLGTSQWKEIEIGFKKYAKKVYRKERTDELTGVRHQKYKKYKGAEIEH